MKRIIPYFLFIISILFATFLWEEIKIPFNLDDSHNGDSYLANEHHSQNDTVRFVIFLSIPLMVLALYYQIFKKNFFYNIKKTIFEDKLFPNSSLKQLKFCLLGTLIIIIFEFSFIDFKTLNHHIDIFHEGLWLTASSNANIKNEFWQSSYIGRGFFGNFYPFLLWKSFDLETIGLARFFNLFIILCNKIFLLLIVYRIVVISNFTEKNKIIFYLILLITILTFTSYISPVFFLRSSLLLLFSFLLLNFLTIDNQKKLNLIFLALLSSFSMFWYIDIGIYINAILILLFFFLILKKEIILCFYLIFFITLGWLFSFLTIPKEEFNYFLINTKLILSTIDYIHGLIFPTPFLAQDARSTKALLLFLITGFLIIREISILKKENQKFLLVMLFLYLISILYFKYGLSRSDGGHIKIASGFVYIPFFSIVYFKILDFVIKQKILSINSKKISLILLLIFFTSIFFNKKYENKNFFNFFSFKNNIYSLIKFSDKIFISKDYQFFINQYKDLTIKDKCVMVFTNEVAIPYLLKKPTCSKYYSMYTATPTSIQKNLIQDLEIQNPVYLIYKSNIDSYGHAGNRLRLLDNYINEQYSFFKKIKHWEVYKKNE